MNTLPTEIFQMIIREYATVSITLQRSSPMNFLAVCQLWRVIGESLRSLFAPHLVVRGHDEIEQLFSLYERKMIPPSFTNLTVNLVLKYAEEPLHGGFRPVPAMAQIQKDIDLLRGMVAIDWVPKKDNVPSHWGSLNLKKFSLVVDVSAVSARRTLLKAWTRAWVSRLSRQWRGMGWKGSEGIYDGNYYSYWDRD